MTGKSIDKSLTAFEQRNKCAMFVNIESKIDCVFNGFDFADLVPIRFYK